MKTASVKHMIHDIKLKIEEFWNSYLYEPFLMNKECLAWSEVMFKQEMISFNKIKIFFRCSGKIIFNFPIAEKLQTYNWII